MSTPNDIIDAKIDKALTDIHAAKTGGLTVESVDQIEQIVRERILPDYFEASLVVQHRVRDSLRNLTQFLELLEEPGKIAAPSTDMAGIGPS
jgi:hypothetical protein